jgi:hypothetical protein
VQSNTPYKTDKVMQAAHNTQSLRKTLLPILVSILALTTTPAQAQGETDFWFVAPQLDDNGATTASNFNRPVYFMITAGDQSATITMEMPALPGFNNRVINLAAGESRQIIFGAAYTAYDNRQMDTIQNNIRTTGIVGVKHDRGIHFTSTAPVSIYYQVDSYNSKDMYALKGSKALGQEFYTPFQTRTQSSTSYPYAYPQFHIVATENSTTVHITPKSNIVGTAAGLTKTITLQRGETFAARAETFMQAGRLDGSHIIADKPIAVTVTDDLIVGGGAADVTGDQIVPVSNLGTSYVVVRGFTNGTDGDFIYILSTAAGTTVNVNGVTSPTLAAGATHIYQLSSTTYTTVVTSNKPVYVYQVSGYGGELGAALVPSMYAINTRRISFYKSGTSYNHNVFVLVRTGNEDAFTVNNDATVLAATNFADVTDMPGWRYTRKDISTLVANGNVTVNNSKGAFALGYFFTGTTAGASSSFGYLSEYGSLSFADTTYKCEGTTITLDGGYAKSYAWTTPTGTATTPTAHIIYLTVSDCTLPVNPNVRSKY